VEEAIQLCLTGEFSQYEGFYQSLTGRRSSYIKADFGPILGDNGTLVGGIGIIDDRTERHEIEKKLRQALIEQRIILENAVIGIAHIKDGKILSCNPKFEAIFGYERNELAGESTEKHFFSSRKSYVELRNEINTLIADGKEHTKERIVKRKDGTSIWVRGIVKSIDPQDISQGIILITEDITQRKQREEELKLAAAVFQNTTEGIMVTDASGILQSVNSAFSRITGYSMDDVIGRKASILESGEQDKDFYIKMWDELREKRSWKGELWNRRKGGDIYPELLSISAVEDNHGEVLHYVGLFSDISERKKYEELIQYKANHDPLTDLPNRRMFYESLNRDLAQGERNRSRLALLFLDLDGFKTINDTLGHDIGDLLLQEIARILEECIRKGDLVARVGGDEFIILLSGVSDRKAGSRVADIILQKIHEPITLKGHPVVIGASIGISCFPDDGNQADDLVKMADDAMYKAKEMGKNNYQFYSNDIK
ncbi:MAG TPA: sensor domain-containing diguanylate cyclase, partial [Spirochaetes bacterium]|nr:sensor domain-containing diguanylate cyclase [Spirochaetota bacterium]